MMRFNCAVVCGCLSPLLLSLSLFRSLALSLARALSLSSLSKWTHAPVQHLDRRALLSIQEILLDP